MTVDQVSSSEINLHHPFAKRPDWGFQTFSDALARSLPHNAGPEVLVITGRVTPIEP